MNKKLMKTGYLKHSIAYIFLILFISMKMVGLHVLTHDDDKDHAIHCSMCDHAVAYNVTPLIAPPVQEFNIENTESIIQREFIKHYMFAGSGSIATNQLFSRPPPVFI